MTCFMQHSDVCLFDPSVILMWGLEVIQSGSTRVRVLISSLTRTSHTYVSRNS